MARPCLFNCKSEGPPGPIWCTQCGHDPKCCTCEDAGETESASRSVKTYDLTCPFCGSPCQADDDCQYCDLTVEERNAGRETCESDPERSEEAPAGAD